MKYIHQAFYLLFLVAVQRRTLSCQLVVGDTKLNRLYERVNKYNQKIVRNHNGQKWTQFYHLDNRSYSTIQPLTYPTYIMDIGEWLSLWDFFDALSEKSIRTAHHKSHQTCKEFEQQPFNRILLSRNKSKWQTN